MDMEFYTSWTNGTLIFPDFVLDTEAYCLVGVEKQSVVFGAPFVDLFAAAGRLLVVLKAGRGVVLICNVSEGEDSERLHTTRSPLGGIAGGRRYRQKKGGVLEGSISLLAGHRGTVMEVYVPRIPSVLALLMRPIITSCLNGRNTMRRNSTLGLLAELFLKKSLCRNGHV